MKIGIIGLGYWGKIILNNLIKMNYIDIELCDSNTDLFNQGNFSKYRNYQDYKLLNCDKIFVCTITSAHFEIVKYFLSQGIDVFCEKPLTTDYKTSSELYEIAEQKNCHLFVDWVFTLNPQINLLKKIISENNLIIRNAIFNRLNLGPERFDVNAVLDLASHDVSIITYLFNKKPFKCNWINFKRNKSSSQDDSTVGVLQYDCFTAQINASWFYGEKVRKCFFEFENGFVYWNDLQRSLEIKIPNIETHPISNDSPIEIALNYFLMDEKFDYSLQKNITLLTQKIIEKNGSEI